MSSSDEQNQSKIRSISKWVIDNKLGTIASVWVTSVAGLLAYQWSDTNKSRSTKFMQTRVFAQAITLAALAGAAAVEYYDNPNKAQQPREPEFLKLEADDD